MFNTFIRIEYICSLSDDVTSDQIDGGGKALKVQHVEEATTETDSVPRDTYVPNEKQDESSFREHTNSNEFDSDQKKFFHGYKDTIKRYKKQISTNSSFNEEKGELN